MRLAIVSGKGGTGKTTVATSLARVLSQGTGQAAYMDCDVEEPNGHLFLHPQDLQTEPVNVMVPKVDMTRCDLCGACGEACQFHAILPLKKQVLTFPKLCHSCGGCELACTRQAISQVPVPVGKIERGRSDDLTFVHGVLDIGQAMATPVIKAVLKAAPPEADSLIIDSPPGTSCPVVESLGGAEAALLVCEPTPFGLHDLALAVDVVRALGMPMGLVINRAGAGGDAEVEAFAEAQSLPILARLPLERQVAEAYAQGKLICEISEAWHTRFADLAKAAQELSHAPRPKPKAPPAVQKIDSTQPPPSKILENEHPEKATHNPKEIVVISGKGGTGKTSIAASLASLATNPALADCDVDAADLHLVCPPKIRQSWNFSGGTKALIEQDGCTRCGLCQDLCRFDAISGNADEGFLVDPIACEGCNVCIDHCPTQTIRQIQPIEGIWSLSDTPYGPMAHARLSPGESNSGKLVTLVRQEGKAIAQLENKDMVFVDGSPGIGCPVQASLTNAAMAVIVTEPTVAGVHDLKRVASLCKQLSIRACVVINKADLHPATTQEIEAFAHESDLLVAGLIRYDAAVTQAQVEHRPVVELQNSKAGQDIKRLWKDLRHAIGITT